MSCPPAAAAVSLGKRAGSVVRHATLKAGPVRKTSRRTVRHATLKAGPVGKTGWRCSASRNPQGGAGEKDVLKTVVTRHKLH